MNHTSPDTQMHYVVTLDGRSPHLSRFWPLYADTIEDAQAEYAADANEYDLPDPRTVTFWQRTSTVIRSPWQQITTV